MTDEKTETKPEKPKPKQTRKDQDQAVAENIAAIRQILETVQADAELAAALAARGYDSARLAEGMAKQKAAQDAFSARQQAIGAQKQGTAALADAQASARETYRDFRDTVRSIFKENAVLSGLGLTGKVPDGLQKFLTAARATYQAALQKPECLSELSKFGFPEAAIKSALAAIDALDAADNTQEAAKVAATRATKERDEAVADLDAWMSQFRGIGKVATRGRPDLAKKIGL